LQDPQQCTLCFCFPYSYLSFDMEKKEINGIPWPSVATQDGFVPVLMTW